MCHTFTLVYKHRNVVKGKVDLRVELLLSWLWCFRPIRDLPIMDYSTDRSVESSIIGKA